MGQNQKSYFYRKGTTPLLETTIPAHFLDIQQLYSDHEAVVSLPQNRRLSYGRLSEEIDRLAKGLMGLGFGRGNRIGEVISMPVEAQALTSAVTGMVLEGLLK